MAAKTKSKPKNGKHPGGRPSAYKKEFARIAYRHTLLGATDKDLALAFEVTEQTINGWKHAHPEFFESLKAGKDEADAVVAESLFKRATGMSIPAVKIFNTERGTIEHPYREHLPPETTAAIFWLKNRKPAIFRNNPEVAVTVNNEVEVDLTKPIEQWGADELRAELAKRKALPDLSRTNGAPLQIINVKAG